MSWDFVLRAFVRGADGPPEEAHRRFKEIFSEAERAELLQPELAAALAAHPPSEVFERHRPGYERLGLLDRLMYLDFKVFLPDCSLHINDITTSAHAVEGRVPFLDREMIELAARVPWRWKVRGLTTKYLVRRAMRDALPPEVVRMRKKGFLIPGAPWLRGELRGLVLDVVGAAENELRSVFRFPYVRRLAAEHFEGRRDHTRRLTCLVSFFMWHLSARASWGGGLRDESSADRAR
jgi:asparagine synthase (glutamine-hydrolysing)